VRGVPAPPSLPFLTRLWFAYVVFFRVLFNGEYAAELRAPAALPPAATKALPVPSAPVAEPAPAAKARPTTDAALQLLALLQREGRFIDFLEEDVASFADADIGAAARDVHRGCRKVLEQHLSFEPVMPGAEEAKVSVPKGFDPAEIRLIGEAKGEPPFRGTLRHHGWRVVDAKLPTLAEGIDRNVIAPAEVELGA